MTLIKNPGRFAGLLYVLTSIVGFFANGLGKSRTRILQIRMPGHTQDKRGAQVPF
jgi:hypothetical protein